MPEGDTVHRAAAELRRALVPQPIVDFHAPRARGVRPEPGERIEAVQAVGKHLLMRFSGGSTLHTHLRMHGSWRILGPDAWRRISHRARAIVRTDMATAVCLDAPVVELLDARDVARHPILSALGPDLATAEPDLDEALARLLKLDDDLPIAVALLDQRVASGIGNVVKSEVLFACGVDPRARLADLPDTLRRELLATAGRLLRANLGPGPRRTVPEGLAVYRRSGRACRRCGSRIEAFRQGVNARITYACPGCQTGGRCD